MESRKYGEGFSPGTPPRNRDTVTLSLKPKELANLTVNRTVNKSVTMSVNNGVRALAKSYAGKTALAKHNC